MLTSAYIRKVVEMRHQLGQENHGFGNEPATPNYSVLGECNPTKPPKPGSVRVRLFDVLTADGDVCIQNITDNKELARLRKENRILE